MQRLSGRLEFAKPGPRQYLRGAQDITVADAVLTAGVHNGQGFEGQGDEHDGSSVRRDCIIVSPLSFTGVPRAHGPIGGAALGEDGCPVAVPLGPLGPRWQWPPQKEASLPPASVRIAKRKWNSMVIDITGESA